MIHFKLPAKVTRTAGKIFLRLKHYSPEICVVTGMGLGVGAMVFTGIKTWKNKEKLAKDKQKINDIKKLRKSVEVIETSRPDYDSPGTLITVTKELVTERELTKEEKHELTAARLDFGVDILKTYILPAGLAVGSGICIWKGRKIFRKIIGVQAAQIAAQAEMIKRLNDEIKKRHPEEAEEVKYGVKTEDVVDEEGNTTETRLITTDSGVCSPYAIIFNQGEWNTEKSEWYWKNYEWSRDNLSNQYKIKSVQDDCTRKLRTDGWVNLLYAYQTEKLGVNLEHLAEQLGVSQTELYDILGNVGWVWTEEKEKENKNYVDFRVFESPYQLDINKRFVNGEINGCVIDPNVDGDIRYIFKDISKYDRRYGKKPKEKLPSAEEMFGDEYAKKLARSGCYA